MGADKRSFILCYSGYFVLDLVRLRLSGDVGADKRSGFIWCCSGYGSCECILKKYCDCTIAIDVAVLRLHSHCLSLCLQSNVRFTVLFIAVVTGIIPYT